MVGSDERIRVSSPMMPPLSGTLKSTRMKTRWPWRSRSLMDSFMVARLVRSAAAARRSESLRHELPQQIDAAVRIAPLVVVPREDLHEVAVHHFRIRHVD